MVSEPRRPKRSMASHLGSSEGSPVAAAAFLIKKIQPGRFYRSDKSIIRAISKKRAVNRRFPVAWVVDS